MHSAPPDFGLDTLLRLAWPIVLARSAQAVVGFSDALMVADLGEVPLAAVTTGSLNFFGLAIFPMGAIFIVQSFAAQLSAASDLQGARRYAYYGLIFATLVAALTMPFLGHAIRALPYEPEVARHMEAYLEVRWMALGFAVGVEVIGNWYGGLGNTRLHMIAAFVMMVTNVVLNWVLIYGNLGAPMLGVRGAAWASLLANALGFGFVALVFFRNAPGKLKGEPLALRLSEFRRMLRFGIPSGLNWFLEFAAFALFVNVSVAYLGTRVLAALMVVINVNSVSFMPAFGVGSAGAIQVGQAVGSGLHDRVPSIVWNTAKISMAWTGTTGLVYLLFPATLFGLFQPPGEDTAALVTLGASMLALSAGWQLFDAIGLTLGECLRGAGDTTWPMFARLVLAWLLFTPGSMLHVIYFGGGYIAVMLWLIAYLAILSGLLSYRFFSGAWRKIDLAGVQDNAFVPIHSNSAAKRE